MVSAAGSKDSPLFPNRTAPVSIRHFGLKPDRGLPIAALPLGEGELVVGAPPKAWRATYVLPKLGLVWSNFFPSWLPTKFYGQWYYLEDWRAMVWDTSEIGPHRRLEISNGLEFIECVAHGPMPAGSAYFCPERPELVVKHSGAHLLVYYPNGTRNTFLNEDAPGEATTPGVVRLGRFALIETARKVAPGGPAGDAERYTRVRAYVRNYVAPSGVTMGTYTPELRLGKINFYDSVPGSSGTRLVSRIILGWRDQNAQTRDCNVDATAEPQCGGGNYCYDGKCGTHREVTQAQECYDWFCGDWWSQGVGAFFSTSSSNATCARELCDGQDASSGCWVDKVPCLSPAPMGDPKLYRIVVPQRVDPANTRPLIYTLHYDVATASGLGSHLPERKFLDRVEDNRAEFGAGQNFTPQPPHFGNTIQFGYEKLYAEHPLRLKGLSFEQGRDRQAFELEFTDLGLMQRVYGDPQTPFSFKYQQPTEHDATTVTFRDPLGLEVVKEFAAVGAVAATTPCDPEQGCDIQLGLVRLRTAEGASSTYHYAATGGATGNLERVIAVDGTETRYTLDETLGVARAVTKLVGGNECMKEVYERQQPAFPTTPTKSTFYVRAPGSSAADRRVRTEEYGLCAPGEASCPPYEWGAVRSIRVTYARGEPVTQTTEHMAGAEGFQSQTTVQDGVVSAVVASIAGREPVFGRPREIETPGVRTQSAKTAEPSTAANPVTSSAEMPANVACDPNEEYCAGLDTSTTTIEASGRDYWKMPDEAMQGALDVLGLAPPDGSERHAQSQSRAMGKQSLEVSTASGEETSEYVPFTGNLLEQVVVQNGFTQKLQNEWMKIEVPNGVGGWQQRHHPTALLWQKTWAGEGDDLVFAGGTYQCFSSWSGSDCAAPNPGEDHTNATHLGPLVTGHYQADGMTKAPPDWILTKHPLVQRYAVIGCPIYTTQAIWGGSQCWGGGDCACGCYCDLSSYDPMWPGPGTCRCGLSSPASDFICRQTFLLDPKVVQDFNNLSPNLHSEEWYREQCEVQTCEGGSGACDNPREL